MALTSARTGSCATSSSHSTATRQRFATSFAEAALSDWVELREGDLCETLKDLVGPIDFVLIDIWTSLARPAIELVASHLRPGAIVMCDNTTAFRDAYGDYFAFVEDPKNRLSTLTLPFDGGFELSVRT